LMEVLVKARIDALAGKSLADLMERKPDGAPLAAPPGVPASAASGPSASVSAAS